MAKNSGVAGGIADQVGAVEIEPMLPLAVPIRPGLAGADGKAKIGRPRGARNKATAAMVEYLRRNYADPLEGMAATITRTVGDLAAELGCSKLEAFALQATAMRDLAPYLYAKVPANLKIAGEGRFSLTIGDEINGQAVEEDQDGGAFDIEGEVVEVEQ